MGINRNLAEQIANRLRETNDCKNVENFDDPATVAAYSIWHFLDRYTRFQMLYLKLFASGLLPIRYFQINTLDVATGPAASMYALSDIYAALKKFGLKSNIVELTKIKLSSDYVEKSQGFRQWVHHFTEHLNAQYYQPRDFEIDSETPYWNVPYHHGNFYDVFTTNFQSTNWWYRRNQGFNLVTVGNFILRETQLNEMLQFLTSVVFGSRNGGVLIFVGSGKQHRSNMEIICEHLQKLKMKRICTFPNDKMFFPRTEEFAGQFNMFYRAICEKLDREDLLRSLDEKTHGDLQNRQQSNRLNGNWLIHTFRKGNLPVMENHVEGGQDKE